MEEVISNLNSEKERFQTLREEYYSQLEDLNPEYLSEDHLDYFSKSFDEVMKEDASEFEQLPKPVLYILELAEKFDPIERDRESNQELRMPRLSRELGQIDREQLYSDIIEMRKSAQDIPETFEECLNSYRRLQELKNGANNRKLSLIAEIEEKFREDLYEMISSSIDYAEQSLVLSGKDPFQSFIESSDNYESFLETYILNNRDKVENWMEVRPEISEEDMESLF